MRLADWPRMPYLNDELREWIAAHLATLGVEEIAIFAVDPQRGQDEERRILVATEVGLIDGWYAPRGGSSARYGFTARLWPWQAVRGVDLRGETYRVWALEHRTRWWLRLARPAFESETDAPELGAALCDFAKVCAVMAEPAGWQAAQEDVPARREQLRVLPAPTEVPPEAGTDVEAVAPTGRPAVPPPMVTPMTPPPEPRRIRPAEAASAVTAAEPEPDVLLDDMPPEEAATAEPPSAAEAAPLTATADEAPTDGVAPRVAVAQPEPERIPEPEPEPFTEEPERTSVAVESEPYELPSPRAPVSADASPPLPPGEEAVDLGEYLPGEEPINLDEYDPDPLGLEGPVQRH